MANLSVNPWNFVSGDVKTATLSASPNGLVQHTENLAIVDLTTTGAHGFAVNNFLTVMGTTNGRFLGWYKVLAVPTGTTATLINLSSTTSGYPFSSTLAGDGGGTVALNEVQQNARIEDISWQNASAAGQLLDMRDRNGFPLWQATATAAGSQNRGKLFWVDGITLVTLQSGVVLVTVN